jgi:uncharacterized protein (TIGR02266 family)
MPDGSRPQHIRAHARFDVAWRVTCEFGDWNSAAHLAAANFSRGGMFVRTEEPPPVGTPVDLTIDLPNGLRLHAAGTVCHTVTRERAHAEQRAPGAGVAFSEASEADLAVLEYVAHTEQAQAMRPPAGLGRMARGTQENIPARRPDTDTEYAYHRKRPPTKPPNK